MDKLQKLLPQFKIATFLLIDLAVAYSALKIMVFFRYGSDNLNTEFYNHLLPFSLVILIFIITFYIFNLYSSRFNRNITDFTNSFIKSVLISFCFSVLIFYIFGNFFKLTPKTNLVIFTTIFSAIDFYLRIITKRYFVKYGVDRKILIVNDKKNNLITELEENQNIGYKIIKEIPTFNLEEITTLKPDAVVIDTAEEIALEKIYSITKKEISIYTVNDFYEEVFQKIPTENITKNDIVSYIGNSSKIFNSIKRFTDIIFSVVLTIILSPLLLATGFLIKITSKGPILIKQKRVTKNEEIFTLYKFRSMVALSNDGQAEKNGAVWTANNNTDPRITSLGRFIRKTHLDELPQLINILMGDISFVGPRPERPEFIIDLRKDILHYDFRHSVKAGLTGWAQVNYKYGASVEDAKEKLKYDFYYIKNKNIFFDFLILLKTVAEIFR